MLVNLFIIDGFTGGHYPYWQLAFTNLEIQDISDCSLHHIAQLMVQGYREGEIIERSSDILEAKIGWWKINL